MTPSRRLADGRAAFDAAAPEYAARTERNRALDAIRTITRHALEARLAPGARVLEIGCGAGCDTVSLVRAGYRVTAIDSSGGMVAQTRARLERAGLNGRATLVEMDLHDLSRVGMATYDAVFSNLGPLNCVDSLDRAAGEIGDRLQPGGWVVASVMGRWCPWEIAVFTARGAWRRAFVRLGRGPRPIPFHGAVVWTRYFSPRSFTAAFRRHGLDEVWRRGLRVLAPPPYLEGFSDRHARLVRVLERADDRIAHWPVLRSLGDHFLIVLQKRW